MKAKQSKARQDKKKRFRKNKSIMPSAAKFGRLLEEQHGDDLDDFGLDDSDNPFGSPTPPPESSSKKRKEPDSGLGIEEEVSVQKRVRVPNVKLDEERYSLYIQVAATCVSDCMLTLLFRLLGPAGIPKLRRRAFGLKLKGKGHEVRILNHHRFILTLD